MILMENFLCLIGKLFHVVGKLNAPICYAAIDYLAQWDYGCESEYDLVEKVDRCPLENWHVRNDHGEEYILIEHPLYMTLYRKVEN